MSSGAAREWALQQLKGIREDPEARVRAAVAFYPERLRDFARAEVRFLRWEIERGVMHPHSGSPWWRAVNDRLLLDKFEAGAEYAEIGSGPMWWRRFLAAPSPVSWYRAHNRSIISGFLDHEEEARAEPEVERFMMNVTLARVVFTHVLAERPALALGRFGWATRSVADPRRSSVGVFLDLHNVFPQGYPLTRISLEEIIAAEGKVARIIDFGLILPKLPELYQFSAHTLEEPRLHQLVSDGLFRYAGIEIDHSQLRPDAASRFVGRLTAHSPRGANIVKRRFAGK
ncbi:hypothetical protein [Nocardia concava]|uniref:hypothetical protein n=1 Tax=Nocardia concava TaxID=257281 RepID=UPI0002E53324|nr:hypothetical protein [Nocardia concava]